MNNFKMHTILQSALLSIRCLFILLSVGVGIGSDFFIRSSYAFPLDELQEDQRAHSADSAGGANLRQRMRSIFESFQGLQPYIASKREFSATENERKLRRSLQNLSDHFSRLESGSTFKPVASGEPGFESTLEVLNELLRDASTRFEEGNKEYARWRLQSVNSYCVSCHTRWPVEQDLEFLDTGLEELSLLELGDFYLATRQFEKASDTYMKLVPLKEYRTERIEALRKWLLIYVRVHPSPQDAIAILARLGGGDSFTAVEQKEIANWTKALRRWQNESKGAVAPLRRAENLIRQAAGMKGLAEPGEGTVELLRATALLHQVASGDEMSETKQLENAASRAKVLYLLGLAYSRLPSYIVPELPELYLERCIRAFPGSSESKEAYRLYADLVQFGFTGSRGTQVPLDVKLKMSQLYRLAYRE